MDPVQLILFNKEYVWTCYRIWYLLSACFVRPQPIFTRPISCIYILRRPCLDSPYWEYSVPRWTNSWGTCTLIVLAALLNGQGPCNNPRWIVGPVQGSFNGWWLTFLLPQIKKNLFFRFECWLADYYWMLIGMYKCFGCPILFPLGRKSQQRNLFLMCVYFLDIWQM